MKRLVLGAVAVLSMVGCGPAQSPECTKYMSCLEIVGPAAYQAIVAQYGATGTCWTSTQAAADSCTAICKSNMVQAKASYPNEAKCQ